MSYIFGLVGITPTFEFFQHQQAIEQAEVGPAYVGVPDCSLDSLLSYVQPIPPQRGWDLDEVVDSVISYWITNEDAIRHWRDRLITAGQTSLLVGRIGNYKALQQEFESLLGKRF
jgi:hypothetical protein